MKDNVRHATPLINASRRSFKDIVEILLMHGANIHAKDFIGFSALSFAIENNHQDIAKLLII